jgi:hypothetical protein
MCGAREARAQGVRKLQSWHRRESLQFRPPARSHNTCGYQMHNGRKDRPFRFSGLPQDDTSGCGARRVRFPLALPIFHILTGVLLTLAHTNSNSSSRHLPESWESGQTEESILGLGCAGSGRKVRCRSYGGARKSADQRVRLTGELTRTER